MRILELCLSPAFGGLEIHVRDFCVWLLRQEEAELFLGLQENSAIDAELRQYNRPTLYYPHSTGKFPYRAARRLAGFIEKNQVDVIHMHWKDDLPLVSLAKRIAKRSVALVHSRHMLLPGKKHDLYHRFIYEPLDRYITITKDLKRAAEQNLPIAKDKISVVYYGVNLPRILSNDERESLKKQFNIVHRFTVGLIGRVCQPKKQHLFVQAVNLLKKQKIEIYAVIAGSVDDEQYMAKLRRQINEEGLNTQITISGFYDRPTDLMQCFDVLIMPSGVETFGLVLIEGMHCGIPVIGSNRGGVLEIIDHGVTGLLFEADDAQSLAEAIARLYNDNALRLQLARAGQQKARKMFVAEEQYRKVLNHLKAF